MEQRRGVVSNENEWITLGHQQSVSGALWTQDNMLGGHEIFRSHGVCGSHFSRPTGSFRHSRTHRGSVKRGGDLLVLKNLCYEVFTHHIQLIIDKNFLTSILIVVTPQF